MKKLFDLLSLREKVYLLLLFGLQVCIAGLEMAGIASIMPFMAVVTNPDVIHTNRWLKEVYGAFQFTTAQDFLFFLGFLLLGLMVFGNVAKAMSTWLTLKYDNGLNYKLARRLLASYLVRPYEFFLNRNTAEMGKNVLTEVRTVIAGVLSQAMSVMASIMISFFILALLMAVDPLIAISIIVILGGCYGLVYAIVRRRLSRIGQEQVEANRQKYKAAGEALGGIKDLKILGREKVFLERFGGHALRHARNNVSAGVISQVPRYVLEMVAFGGILLLVLYFLGNEEKSVGMVPLLALYAFAGYRLLPALQQIFAGVTLIRFSLAALDLLHEDLTARRGEAEPESILNKTERSRPLPLKSMIEVKDLAFSYSGTREFAIKGVNLTIPVNTTVGFVGATGSGKTTTVDIILGLLPPSSGRLLVDGNQISGENVALWQRNLGYVPQNIFLCDDTIARNIAFGVRDTEIDMEAVVGAARIANLADFIDRELPDGYETVIGERGMRLSGGQRQRVGIARALYMDPAVLIMDEATSSLDGVTEEAVMDAIRNLLRKKTIIMIAHRLTTVKDCDMIYVFDRGRIVEQGSYFELERSSEWFRAAARTGIAG